MSSISAARLSQCLICAPNFSCTPKDYGERTCIIVVQVAAPSGDSTLMGAVVDAVEEVVQLGAADIEATPDFGGAPETQYILGLATIQGDVKILLNIEKIFLEDRTLSLPHIAKAESSIQPEKA